MTTRTSPPFLDWLRPHLYPLCAPLVALAAVALFELTPLSPLAQKLEYGTVNLRFQTRAPFDPPADPQIVLVGIDQFSLDQFGRWPWPRTTIAQFLTGIATANANPRAVGFDVMYTEKAPEPGADQALADAAGLLPNNVITGALSVELRHPLAVQKMDKIRTQADSRTPDTPSPSLKYGDVMAIRGSDIATFPIESLRKQSLFAFCQ